MIPRPQPLGDVVTKPEPLLFTVNYGAVELDPYQLPPLVHITEGDIQQILGFCTTLKMRKYYAAAIILGQPFNQHRTRQ